MSWILWFKMRILRIRPYDCNLQGIIDYLERAGHLEAALDLASLRDAHTALTRRR